MITQFKLCQKSYYDQHEILHKCHKMPYPDYMVRHTGNGDIKVYFWIVIPVMIQQVAMQSQLLVCSTKARGGILFGENTFDQ